MMTDNPMKKALSDKKKSIRLSIMIEPDDALDQKNIEMAEKAMNEEMSEDENEVDQGIMDMPENSSFSKSLKEQVLKKKQMEKAV